MLATKLVSLRSQQGRRARSRTLFKEISKNFTKFNESYELLQSISPKSLVNPKQNINQRAPRHPQIQVLHIHRDGSTSS